MRELINIIDKLDFLAEDSKLNPAAITKYQWRFNKFIDMIRSGDSFYTVDREEVVADPDEAERFQALKDEDNFKGSLKLKLNTGEEIALGRLLKTAALGGQAATGDSESSSEVGKETALLKPSQIGITDREIPASELGSEIINSEVLNSTEYGKIVVNMAKEIMAGKNPVIPENVPAKVKSSIHDYAGEYLGVLALVKGTSRFPKRQSFETWLGGAVADLTILFPSKANTNIADSFATIKNKKTKHSINISSKGKGGGAPPSISGLKIPEHLKGSTDYEASLEFIELCQADALLPKPKTVSQVFYCMNVLARYVPESVPEEFKKFLPWQNQTIQEVNASLKAFKTAKPIDLSKYQSLWKNINFKKPASDGGKLTYAVKRAVMVAVNENKALPYFQNVILEILDMNFIQQYADVSTKKGPKVMTFDTQWPAKLEGKITLESKTGAGDPTKGGFSFKLSNATPKTDIPEPDESSYEDEPIASKADLRKQAKQITKGGSKDVTDIFKKPESPKGVGRAKRK